MVLKLARDAKIEPPIHVESWACVVGREVGMRG
jgi:hypothetical protein